MSDAPFALVAAITLGAVLADVIAHPTGFEIMVWRTMYGDRCHYCGYKFDHPIVKHDEGYLTSECGWR